MGHIYECLVCDYYTGSSKSFKLHSIQCPKLKQLQDAQEEILRRKQSLQEPRDPRTAWKRLRALNSARNDGIEAKQVRSNRPSLNTSLMFI